MPFTQGILSWPLYLLSWDGAVEEGAEYHPALLESGLSRTREGALGSSGQRWVWRWQNACCPWPCQSLLLPVPVPLLLPLGHLERLTSHFPSTGQGSMQQAACRVVRASSPHWPRGASSSPSRAMPAQSTWPSSTNCTSVVTSLLVLKQPVDDYSKWLTFLSHSI